MHPLNDGDVRARYTIEVLGLNREKLIISRRKAFKDTYASLARWSQEEEDDPSYEYHAARELFEAQGFGKAHHL